MNHILTPTDEQQLSQIISECKANETALRISGGGTRAELGAPVNATTTLSLSAIKGVNLYEPGALTLVAKAGTPLKDIQALLKSEGQRLAFEPMDHRSIYASQGEPTIGGIVACNISGSRRIQAGACRDALIGVQYVNGHGEIIKNGGRVMKNVTGLDLVKLMAGSYGTLGVMTEVAFKVLPILERQATLAIGTQTIDQAIAAMSASLGSPFEVTGAAYMPNKGQTLLRVEGFSTQVDYRLKKLTELVASGHDVEVVEGKKHDDLWQSIRKVEMFNNVEKPLWRLSVKPSDAVEISNILAAKTDAKLLFDWGGGLIWAEMPDANNAHADIVRGAVQRLGGHATLVRASAKVKANIPVFHPQAAGVAKLSELIRKKSDPSNIFNFGLMG